MMSYEIFEGAETKTWNQNSNQNPEILVAQQIKTTLNQKTVTVTITPQTVPSVATNLIVKQLLANNAQLLTSQLPLENFQQFKITRLLLINQFFQDKNLKFKCNQATFHKIRKIICYFQLFYAGKNLSALPLKINIVTADQAKIVGQLNVITRLKPSNFATTKLTVAALKTQMTGSWVKSQVPALTSTKFDENEFKIDNLWLYGKLLTDKDLQPPNAALRKLLSIPLDDTQLLNGKSNDSNATMLDVTVTYTYAKNKGQFGLTIDCSKLMITPQLVVKKITNFWNQKQQTVIVNAQLEPTVACSTVVKTVEQTILIPIVSQLPPAYQQLFMIDKCQFGLELLAQTTKTPFKLTNYQKAGDYQVYLSITYLDIKFDLLPINLIVIYQAKLIVAALNHIQNLNIKIMSDSSTCDLVDTIKSLITNNLTALAAVNFKLNQFQIVKIFINQRELVNADLVNPDKFLLTIKYQYEKQSGEIAGCLDIEQQIYDDKTMLVKLANALSVSPVTITVDAALHQKTVSSKILTMLRLNDFLIIKNQLPFNLQQQFDTLKFAVENQFCVSPIQIPEYSLDDNFYQTARDCTVFYYFGYEDNIDISKLSASAFAPLHIKVKFDNQLIIKSWKAASSSSKKKPIKIQCGITVAELKVAILNNFCLSALTGIEKINFDMNKCQILKVLDVSGLASLTSFVIDTGLVDSDLKRPDSLMINVEIKYQDEPVIRVALKLIKLK